jgi:glutathione synthase/RimK-type ligase-like ATP-grasp enzyme
MPSDRHRCSNGSKCGSTKAEPRPSLRGEEDSTNLTKILLLGSRKDANIRRLSEALSELGRKHAILDYRESIFSFKIDTSGHFSLTVDDQEISENAAVFDRVLMLRRTQFYPEGEPGESDFVANEYKGLYNLIAQLYGAKVVNPLASRQCLVKPHQQRLAAQAGFLVPTSIVTNNKSDMLSFADEADGNLIIKPLSTAMFYPDNDDARDTVAVLTSRIAQETLAKESPRDLAYGPSFLQHEIAKKFELRIVYIAGSLFAFRIDSQDHKRSETDWRRLSHELQYHPHELGDDICWRIDRFMNNIGFVFGSIDIVIDVNGNPWFLECNNQGVWAWLDDIVGGAITRAIADHLVTISGC